ncbi:MAG: hypothetical protein ACTSYD_02275 [Candidatus Heimdallarchaeaceae archaeon]
MRLCYTIVSRGGNKAKDAELIYPEKKKLAHRLLLYKPERKSYIYCIDLPNFKDEFAMIRVKEDDGDRILLIKCLLGSATLVADKKFDKVQLRSTEFRIPITIMKKFLDEVKE